MRLICPNCSAQYEIDASLIPDEGRDVQCSNCGHTWFELPPPADFAAPPAEAAPLREPEPEDEDEEPEAEATPEPAAEVVTRPAREPEAEPATTPAASSAVRAIAAATMDAEEEDEDEPDTGEDGPDTGEDEDEPVAPTQLKRRRPGDVAALDIIKEEADRELARRRAEPTAPIETQTDMHFDEVRDRRSPSRALRARMAKSGSEETRLPDREVSDRSYQAPRKDLLPDIDEINSSLKPRPERDPAEAATERRGGFRAGFILMIVLTAALIFAYAQAPTIAAKIPALEPALIAYVDIANGLRDWIDGLIAPKA